MSNFKCMYLCEIHFDFKKCNQDFNCSIDEQYRKGQPQPSAPTRPKTVLEALEQRMTKYQASSDEATKEGNGGKARRMGRIVKQYKDAIRSHKAGRPVNFDELPVPPGFPPIPGMPYL